MRRIGIPLAVALAFGALAVQPFAARGEWYDYYLAAKEAIEQGRPKEAIAALQAALARRPKPGYYRTYGSNYLRYTPYYLLGVALHDTGRCEEALQAFATSTAEDELADRPGLAAQRRALQEACATKLQEREAAPAPQTPSAPAPVRLQRALLEHAVSDYLGGRFDAARKAFESLVRQAPESATLHAMLASVLVAAAAGEQEPAALAAAREELERALQLDPSLELDARFFSPRVIETVERLR